MKQITETRLWINGIFMGGQVMKILAFDIGGTAIKYSICEDDRSEERRVGNECT